MEIISVNYDKERECTMITAASKFNIRYVFKYNKPTASLWMDSANDKKLMETCIITDECSLDTALKIIQRLQNG